MIKPCPDEFPIRLFINENQIAVFQLTNSNLVEWVYGYLFCEGFILSKEDVGKVNVNKEDLEIRVVIHNDDVLSKIDNERYYTSGCGRGMTFLSMTDVKSFSAVTSEIHSTISDLIKKRKEFAAKTPMYLKTGGMHGACLVLCDGTIVVFEDIGRHNAIDKAIGYILMNDLSASDLIIMTTGRISYEMMAKVAKIGIPIVVTRTTATRQALQLAKFLNIEVVTYLRGSTATILTNCARVTNDLLKGE